MYFDCIRDDVEGGGGAKFQRRLCEALGWLTFGCRLELVKRNLVATIRKSYALQMFITTTIQFPLLGRSYLQAQLHSSDLLCLLANFNG